MQDSWQKVEYALVPSDDADDAWLAECIAMVTEDSYRLGRGGRSVLRGLSCRVLILVLVVSWGGEGRQGDLHPPVIVVRGVPAAPSPTSSSTTAQNKSTN